MMWEVRQRSDVGKDDLLGSEIPIDELGHEVPLTQSPVDEQILQIRIHEKKIAIVKRSAV